ncbi:hypothetical protein TanjilG_14899 [Lupinus angustifolius]|uniref:EKN n=1 Tax=Lupinus angustifolius TaxID=3871 RepID=A0A1J7G783_LUPAN|nr:PREDICTED: uncharacterized protein LOC109329515 isoform X2 [Lupinus angustifolius]OIV96222.1 hypothetical protein TanjilG_14899 [Lupinus angustifolius]
MGNCGSNPKTNEGVEEVPLPVPVVIEEVKVVQQQENKLEDNASKVEDLPLSTQNSEPKVEEPKEAEKGEIKPEINEEKPSADKN